MLNYITTLFKISLILLLLPPLTLPVLPSLMNINIIGRIFLVVTFVLTTVKFAKSKSMKFTRSEFTNFYLISFFVILNAFSFLNAINIFTYIKAYEKLLMGFFIYCISFALYKLNKKAHLKNVITVLAIIMVFRLLMEGFIYLHPNIFFSTFQNFIKTETFMSFQANLLRERTYVDLLAESFIPIGFYFLITYKKVVNKLALAFIIISQVAISFLSNWRGRFINALFVLLITVIGLSKIKIRNLKVLGLTVIIIIPILLIFDRLQLASKGFSVIDRLANASEVEDAQTIDWRIKATKEAFLMANFKLFGVGLGNYYEHTTLKPQGESLFTWDKKALAEAAVTSGPHNIFAQFLAEGGYITVSFFLVCLIYFLRQDISVIFGRKGSLEYFVLAASFWGLIFGTLFYPATALSFYISFFVLRSTLQKN